MIDLDEVRELKWQARKQRSYAIKLSMYPKCNDPDHPGCYICNEEEEGEEDED